MLIGRLRGCVDLLRGIIHAMGLSFVIRSGVLLTLPMLAACNGTPPPESAATTAAQMVGNQYDQFDGAFTPVAGSGGGEPQATTSDNGCSVDKINGRMAADAPLDHDGVGRFEGWVGNLATGTPPKTFRLVLVGAGRYTVEGKTGQQRPDVAQVHRLPKLATSGFKLAAKMSAVPIGSYRVVLTYTMDGHPITCDAGLDVQVE